MIINNSRDLNLLLLHKKSDDRSFSRVDSTVTTTHSKEKKKEKTRIQSEERVKTVRGEYGSSLLSSVVYPQGQSVEGDCQTFSANNNGQEWRKGKEGLFFHRGRGTGGDWEVRTVEVCP